MTLTLNSGTTLTSEKVKGKREKRRMGAKALVTAASMSPKARSRGQ